MKLYNPFKPHVVEWTPVSYGVRRFSLFNMCWKYNEVSDANTWYVTPTSVGRWCSFANKAQAFERKHLLTRRAIRVQEND